MGDKALSTVQQAAKDAKKALPKDAQKKINQAGNTADQAVDTVKGKVDAATNVDKSNSKNGKGGGY
jgi:multidrug efflux pump subunit AcrB